MRFKLMVIGLSAYAFIALLTFGVAWNLDYKSGCQYDSDCAFANMVESTAKAVAWPLYVSVKGFQFLRKESHDH